MSHNHGPHSCRDEGRGHDDHDHEEEDESQLNLYAYMIDLPNLAVYNAGESGGCKVIKPWHERNDESSV